MVGFGCEGGRKQERAGKEVKLKAPQKAHEAPVVGKKNIFFKSLLSGLKPAGQCTKHSVSHLAFVLLVVQRKITGGGGESHHG